MRDSVRRYRLCIERTEPFPSQATMYIDAKSTEYSTPNIITAKPKESPAVFAFNETPLEGSRGSSLVMKLKAGCEFLAINADLWIASESTCDSLEVTAFRWKLRGSQQVDHFQVCQWCRSSSLSCGESVRSGRYRILTSVLWWGAASGSKSHRNTPASA